MRSMVIKKVKFDSAPFWCDNRGSYYLIMIDHDRHMIEFESCGGASPNWDSLVSFCVTDKDVQKELNWAAKEYSRKYPISFNEREGMSGCRDISLFVLDGVPQHSWATNYVRPVQVLRLHISCAGKMNEGIPDMFAGDLLDILVYSNVKATGKRLYRYLKPQRFNNVEISDSACGYYK